MFRDEVYKQLQAAKKENGIIYIKGITEDEFDLLKKIHGLYKTLKRNLGDGVRYYDKENEYFSNRNELNDFDKLIFNMISSYTSEPYNKAERDGETYPVEEFMLKFAGKEDDFQESLRKLERSKAITLMPEKDKTSIYINPYLANNGKVSQITIDMFGSYTPLSLLGDINLLNRMGEAELLILDLVTQGYLGYDELSDVELRVLLDDMSQLLKSYSIWVNKKLGFAANHYLEPISKEETMKLTMMPKERFDKAFKLLEDFLVLHVSESRVGGQRIFVNPFITETKVMEDRDIDPFLSRLIKSKDIIYGEK